MVKEQGIECKKTMVFCPTINSAARLHWWLPMTLDSDAFVDGKRSHDQCMINMYHSHNDEETRLYVQSTFVKANSIIRVLVCTVALGLGIQIPDVRLVVHWGLTDSILQYWQEVGRAGRDGHPALAKAYIKPVAPHSKENPLRKAFSQGGCVRRALLDVFLGQHDDVHATCGCKCCARCSQQCTCWLI